MAQFSNNNNFLDSLKKLKKDIENGGSKNAITNLAEEETEKYEEKTIEIDDKDLLFDNKNPFSISKCCQKSDVERYYYNVLMHIFGDVCSVNLVEHAKFPNNWVFEVYFNYTTKEQVEAKKKAFDITEDLTNAISSKLDPEKLKNTVSMAETIISISKIQAQNSYDASKYAQITKSAKELMSSLIFRIPKGPMNPNGKLWVDKQNYVLYTTTGQQNTIKTYTNIQACVVLDAVKVLETIAATKDERGKVDFVIENKAYNALKTDAFLEIKKINKDERNKLSSKYGVRFNKNR